MRSEIRPSRPASLLIVVVLVASLGILPGAAAQSAPTTPEEFFGFEMGADRQLARWDRMVEYFELLESESDRIQVTDMGPSTEGNPFLLLTISSPENLGNLERIAEVSRTLADPRGVPEDEIEAMIGEGRAVVAQTLGLHSTEVAGCQTGVELAYDFAARDDAEARRILDETILLLMPCINPDGQVMITDWYRQWVGTEYEGAGLPYLYQTYAGHDNNRDGDYMQLTESVYIGEVLYREWKPQAYVDHHQMGGSGARMYVPPYSEPIRPGADPLQWRELAWYGAHIAYKLEEHGKTGILNAGQYPGWGHFGWHWITPFHNITGMLTESASANLATPVYLHPDQLSGGARGWPEYEEQSNIPSLWPGGWWRVRDIVEQQKIAAWALQDMAARNRETVLRNMYLKATRQTRRGAEGEVKAYVVPMGLQHDEVTAVEMINRLRMSDIEIQQANEPFVVDGMHYEPGSFVISMAQPKMGLVENLLGRTFYPDNTWTRSRNGSPLRPYDLSTHTMSEFMGVRVDPVDQEVLGDFDVLEADVPVEGTVASGAAAHRLDGRLNASFEAANLLLDRGVDVQRAGAATGGLQPGDFIVAGAPAADLEAVARETGVDFEALDAVPSEGVHDLERRRLGMYRRYSGGNMDEGWTRMVFEQFSFPYTSIRDDEIQAGDLNASYDVIVFPHDDLENIKGEEDEDEDTPPEYRSGIGDEGVAALVEFVENGGTLVTLGGAAELVLAEEGFDVAVDNVLEGVGSDEFFAPGSTLHVDVDAGHPLAWGMPEAALGLFWGSPVFEIDNTDHGERYRRVVVYPERDLLRSGWLLGEETIAERAAVVTAEVGEGEVVLIGIRAQHRAQTDGTFKLLFNAIMR